jgi:hypothetical protein
MRATGIEAVGRSFDWLSAITRSRELDAASASGLDAVDESVRRGPSRHMSGRPDINERNQRNSAYTDAGSLPPRRKLSLTI